MNNAREILTKFKAGTCTDEERLLVEKWMLNHRAGESSGLSDEDFEESRNDIWLMVEQNREHKAPKIRLWPRLLAAACIVIIISAGLWFFKGDRPVNLKAQNSNSPQDIRPGGDKAILTLSNGAKISLGEVANGEIAKQAGIQITKTGDGQLIYKVLEASSGSSSNQLTFNTIETPRGGQYQIILPDQSHVWLNAESSLRYPTTFSGNERKVELKGEAYFEVAHNKDLPFKVETSGQVVQVLGTHFNINSYSDEPSTKTTLINGSVKVYGLSSNESEFLAPGEQSSLTKYGRLDKVAGVNIQEAIAWKNKLFYFDNSNIEAVMRQLARWYDVKVEYEGKVPQVRLSGEMYRRTNATKVLEILSYFNVKYRIENAGNKDQKIIISQ